MTRMGVGLRVEGASQLRTYAAILPLGVRDLDAAIAREATDNPWLDVVDRPLRGLGTDATRGLPASGPSLVEHLDVQLRARALAPDVLRAARSAIGLLDDHAYLRDDVSAVARLANVGEAAAAAGIAAVQDLEPSGVAARSLGERFRLQLRERGCASELTVHVTRHLDELAERGAATFAAAHDVAPDRLALALAELRRCDPDPTRDFGASIERVFPEIVFERDGDSMTARTDGRFWPDVRLASLGVTRGLSEPMRRARARARLTIDALARRRTTLERLAIALLARQAAFLAEGDPRDLVPLSGRDLARDLGCAESTISRAIAGRYAVTPFGVMPLRALLARRPGTIDLTTAAVRERVRDVLEAAPSLSDDAIARTLKLRGIRLARRTVSKYRRELGLPALHRRRTP